MEIHDAIERADREGFTREPAGLGLGVLVMLGGQGDADSVGDGVRLVPGRARRTLTGRRERRGQARVQLHMAVDLAVVDEAHRTRLAIIETINTDGDGAASAAIPTPGRGVADAEPATARD